MQNRLHWVDIAKGILIAMVVVYHLPFVAKGVIHNDKIDCMVTISGCFASYFMAAFFILTGYCSSFEKRTKNFIISNLKSLVLPDILFSFIIYYFYLVIAGDFSLNRWFDIDQIKRFLLYGTFWFLSALFFSKLIFYILYHSIKNRVVLAVISLALMFLGLLLYSMELPNYWFYQHGLVFCPFIAFGRWLRVRPNLLKNNFFIIVGGAITILSGLSTHGLGLPYVDMTYNMMYNMRRGILLMPLSLVYGIGGSLMIFRISQLIGNNKLIELFGRNSLVIYILNNDIEANILSHMLVFETLWLNIVVAMLTALATLFLALIVSLIIKRYFKWMLGVF